MLYLKTECAEDEIQNESVLTEVPGWIAMCTVHLSSANRPERKASWASVLEPLAARACNDNILQVQLPSDVVPQSAKFI